VGLAGLEGWAEFHQTHLALELLLSPPTDDARVPTDDARGQAPAARLERQPAHEAVPFPDVEFLLVPGEPPQVECRVPLFRLGLLGPGPGGGDEAGAVADQGQGRDWPVQLPGALGLNLPLEVIREDLSVLQGEVQAARVGAELGRRGLFLGERVQKREGRFLRVQAIQRQATGVCEGEEGLPIR
jgi:hypothetical protein